jgi:hypothetical protein
MSNEGIRTRQRKLHVEPMDAIPETGGPSPLLQQAQAWADVAREANEECVTGDEAEKELQARRNESGQ